MEIEISQSSILYYPSCDDSRFKILNLQSTIYNLLRRRADSNRRIKVLQTSPLPLGYGAG